MKILYGVQGTGHGHVVRSREMVRELKARGHDVHCVLTARRQGSFPGMEVFEPCTVFRGFTGVAGAGRIRTVRTLFGLRIRKFSATCAPSTPPSGHPPPTPDALSRSTKTSCS